MFLCPLNALSMSSCSTLPGRDQSSSCVNLGIAWHRVSVPDVHPSSCFPEDLRRTLCFCLLDAPYAQCRTSSPNQQHCSRSVLSDHCHFWTDFIPLHIEQCTHSFCIPAVSSVLSNLLCSMSLLHRSGFAHSCTGNRCYFLSAEGRVCR